MANINRVVLVGNLTRDPELRHTPSGMAVCSLRLAVNTRRKDSATGEWTEKPNYFDITVWGNQGENCAQYLSKGRPVGVDGRPGGGGGGAGGSRRTAPGAGGWRWPPPGCVPSGAATPRGGGSRSTFPLRRPH